MSDYKHTLLIPCPEGLLYEGNQLALILGTHPNDVNTFTSLTHGDANGNRYAVSCATVTTAFLDRSFRGEINAPNHAPNADVPAAQSLLASLRTEGPAAPDALVVRIDMDPEAALADMGLVQLQEGVISL